jgi:hypothetical protein
VFLLSFCVFFVWFRFLVKKVKVEVITKASLKCLLSLLVGLSLDSLATRSSRDFLLGKTAFYLEDFQGWVSRASSAPFLTLSDIASSPSSNSFLLFLGFFSLSVFFFPVCLED